ncbi:MAG: DUF2142 domain-containing protein [Egibacteraceae bacterium]
MGQRTRRFDAFALAPVSLIVGVTLLVLGWLIAEPPFSSPDERDHYSRALSVPSTGLIGERIPDYYREDFTPQQLAKVRQEVRWARLPAGLSPLGWDCHIYRPQESAACLDRIAPAPDEPTFIPTTVGSYPPWPYLLPGYVGVLARDPGVANVLASGASALTCLILLALAALVLWQPDRGAVSEVGLAVALTPMVVYIAASLNPSGPEIAAGAALGAGLLRLARPAAPTRLAWITVAAAGAVLTLSRQMSPVWLVSYGAVFLLWGGLRPAVKLIRAHLAAAGSVLAVLCVSLVVWTVWQSRYGTEATVSLAPLPDSLLVSWPSASIWQSFVGKFSYLEYDIPAWIIGGWYLIVLGLGVAALALGTARQRLVLLLVAVAAVLAPLLLQAALMRHTGYATQGRHVLPFLVLLPLLAGEVVASRGPLRGGPRVVLAAVGFAVAALQVSAWYAAARRAAVGTAGTWAFIGRSQWNPPGGWAPWFVVTVTGSVLVAASLALSAAPARLSDVLSLRTRAGRTAADLNARR